MNNDVDNFINFLNKHSDSKNSKKRGRENISTNDIHNDLKQVALERLENMDKSSASLKGRELTKFLESLKDIFKQVMFGLKNDREIKKELPDIMRLAIIAELSVCNNIIDDLKIISMANRSKTLIGCIKEYRKNLDNEPSNKKSKKSEKELSIVISKLTNKETKKDEDYEDDSEYESSEDGDNEDDSDNKTNKKNKKNDNNDADNEDGDDSDGDDDDNDDDDEDDEDYDEDEDREIKANTNSKDGKELINQVFNMENNEDEDIILKFFTKLPKNERQEILSKVKEITSYQSSDKPILFRIMDMPIELSQKNHILKTYTSLVASRFPEKKLRGWFDAVMSLPFGNYKGINLKEMEPEKIKDFLDNLKTVMDQAVYGHDEAKRQIVQLMGQQIRNPGAKGSMLGIYGCPGNGKTSLVKEGIAKAMDKPFIYISLGGATDASFLEGHSYTYEGSIYGRIANGLINAKCMDPIIYFDELDKISKTPKGEEISNILVHLTDPVQNSHFRDKYFHGLDIDLSRATMIFSFNDPSNVNPILMDRITSIETKHLIVSQKLHIAQNYLIPEMIKDMGMKLGDVEITSDTIKYMIDNWTNEGGVRKLKSLLYSVIREVNIANLTKVKISEKDVVFPFKIDCNDVKVMLKHKREITSETIHKEDKCGVINGLFATTSGAGGILSIQTLWIPSTVPLDVKATGNLQTVIKESTQVATTLAFNYLDKEVQEKILAEMKEKPRGIHLHFPDGSTPKDGPSAGTALTVALYSLLSGKKIKHDVAITGEINFLGRVTAIGGLENKLEGAKKAGVTLVLYPKENQKDIDQIVERNPTLIDDKLKVVAIETIDEALSWALAS